MADERQKKRNALEKNNHLNSFKHHLNIDNLESFINERFSIAMVMFG